MGNAARFSFGTATWGMEVKGDPLDRLYATFRENGGTEFDTAHSYAAWLPGGLGVSERTLGELVRRHGDEGRVSIATKGGHVAYPGLERPDGYLAPDVVARDLAESLERLRVDRIDLYYLHRDDERVPVGEVIDALAEHVAAGRVSTLGASNWTTARLSAANEYAKANGRPGFVASQCKYGLAVPNESGDASVPPFTDDDAAYLAGNGVALYAYTPTASGYFATDGQRGRGSFHNAATARRLENAKRLAGETGTTPDRLALAWLLHRPGRVVPVLGTKDVDHLRDALAAADLRLTPEQWAALTA